LLPGATQVTISATTGQGLAVLEAALATTVRRGTSSEASPVLISARQCAAVERALQQIQEDQAARAPAYPLDHLIATLSSARHAGPRRTPCRRRSHRGRCRRVGHPGDLQPLLHRQVVAPPAKCVRYLVVANRVSSSGVGP